MRSWLTAAATSLALLPYLRNKVTSLIFACLAMRLVVAPAYPLLGLSFYRSSHFISLSKPLFPSRGVVKYHVADAPPGALIGNPVSPGVVEGPVRVIHNPQTETLNPGEILVAPFTDPGWTPLFINASGLIMEVGGIMTHGSVVAREYGIPAVVGVREATNTLQTGQLVRIDGNRGIIELL